MAEDEPLLGAPGAALVELLLLPQPAMTRPPMIAGKARPDSRRQENCQLKRMKTSVSSRPGENGWRPPYDAPIFVVKILYEIVSNLATNREPSVRKGTAGGGGGADPAASVPA
ncbi:MAG: hypothetical protein ACRDPA_14430, partial [Solirubrobacteraceae bacterium]